ncbi:hypothetical protein XA68_11648 [Ophiocordyceps unilateralis]|uniref:Uncharacterized protein n=1 Tax=Ophiocordyceps unilateralis TaxID=268505 RepID=A0A2A9PGF3_OPHUN|nr:hypothetical protein XA68_11648 [Ophiocordyceps unilateralis]
MLSPSAASSRLDSPRNMALFPFPASGRKKKVLHPSSTEPLSKAHKILGSTPLSIDAPPFNGDDASSSALSDDRSATSVTSCDTDSVPGYDDGHLVGIAKSDNDSDLFPRPPRLDFDDSDAGHSILRKSRSSSTIKSWYDKSKLPLSVSQQTSSSAMAKGLPRKPDRTPAVGNCHDTRNNKKKKKPAGLDLAGSPSILSTLAPTLRPRQRRHTEETLPSPRPSTAVAPSQRPSPPWLRPNDALNALPTLYDHYEQRSMRHVMRQYSQPDLTQSRTYHAPARPRPENHMEAGHGSSCLNWLHDPVPPSHEAARDTKLSDMSSPTTNSTRTVSSRQTRTSSASKMTTRSFGSADLSQMSVLLLSDSEGEDEEAGATMPYLRSPTLASVKRRPSPVSVERPSMPDLSLPPQAAKVRKRASFSLAHTYLDTVPGEPVVDAPPSITNDSFSVTPTSPPRRLSLSSSHSTNSAATAHSRTSSYSIREARAITLKAARHPSPLVQGASEEVLQQKFDWKPTFQRESVASSADQMTPPLSPTSVDFYIRSAHSSVDGRDSHSRLMAVSRQEEMLLSALRNRHRTMRSSSLAELRESNEWGHDDGDKAAREGYDGQGAERPKRTSQRRGSRDQRNRASPRPTVEMATAGGELSAQAESRHERQPGGRAHRRWSAAAIIDPDSGGGGSKHDSGESIGDGLFEKVPLFLDTEPRPDPSDFRDWHMALTSRSASQHALSEPQRRGSNKSDSGASPSQFHPESFARLAGVTEESHEAAGDEMDVPRPDSPISPQPFSNMPPSGRPGAVRRHV